MDRDLAGQLRDWLVEAGHAVFLDIHPQDGIAVGQEWESRIYERLRWADAVVCVVSAAFVSSEWCRAEMAIARSGGRRLLPVRAEAGVEHPLLVAHQYADYAADASGARAALLAAVAGMPSRRKTVSRLLLVAGLVLLLVAPDAGIAQAAIIGPGCPTLNPAAHDDWDTHANWAPSGGDYTGSQLAGGQGCFGQSFFILDQPQNTALFRWHVSLADKQAPHHCDLWTYIPTANAGDRHARYDFYADDGKGDLAWLGWPGHTIDQQYTAGWTPLGSVDVPANAFFLTVILNNQDAATTKRWYAGAGDLRYSCQ